MNCFRLLLLYFFISFSSSEKHQVFALPAPPPGEKCSCACSWVIVIFLFAGRCKVFSFFAECTGPLLRYVRRKGVYGLNSGNDEVVNRQSLSFDDLYRLYATDILRVSYYYLGNREQAEDVTQDVFVRLLANRPSLEPGREKAWLLKVALNRCRDLWRGSWFKKVVLGHPAFELFPAPDEIGMAADRFTLVEAVNRLRPEFKEVILLFYYQGFSVAEIADMLDIAEGTVSSRLSRARSKLQEDLKQDDLKEDLKGEKKR